MSNPIVKVLVALIVSILVASSLGISPGLYVGATLLSIVLSVLVGAIPVALLVARDATADRVQNFATLLICAISLAVDAHQGFSLHQIIVVSSWIAVSTFVLEFIFPTRDLPFAFGRRRRY